MTKFLLKRSVASSVRLSALSIMGDKLKIMKKEEEIKALQSELEEMKESVTDSNNAIKRKTGGYGFDDLFEIRQIEKEKEDGKVSTSNKLFWKYPETLLPSQSDTDSEDDESSIIDEDSDSEDSDDKTDIDIF